LIPHALERLPPKGSVTKADDEFPIELEMEGAELRRTLAAFILDHDTKNAALLALIGTI